ncbi:unnamed protein product [Ilex paraguariensis]|uniref:Uncharacterized protein n=1 Tax=Ilex paraguariensis TaxID=185542 RepID=A0ABC8T017_9AQUA
MENSKSDNKNEGKTSSTADDLENPSNSNNVSSTTVVEAVGGGESNIEVVNGTRNENNESSRSSGRTPFTNLSQIDADLALARTLQEQERAYMMLRMNDDGSDYGSSEVGSYMHEVNDDDFDNPSEEEDYDGIEADDDEDVFDVHANAEAEEEDNDNLGVELDPSAFPSDELYARALQDAEDREMASRLLALAGINGREAEDTEVHGGVSQVQYCF